MRILQVTQTYAPEANGQAVFVTHLAEGLRSSGHSVAVLMPNYGLKEQHLEKNNVSLVKLKAIPFKPLFPQVRMALATPHTILPAIESFHPDIIHLQDHYPLAWAAYRVARRRGLPIIGTNHFLPENLLRNLPVPHAILNGLTRALWQTWRLTYDHLDWLTAPTPTAAQILRDLGAHPIVTPISCGIDLKRFHPRPSLNTSAIRKQFGLAPDKALFMFVGRIDSEKRLDVLLHAAALLHDQNFQIAIIGQGLHQKTLQQLQKTLGLQDKVVFTGFAPAESLPQLLNAADIFVMPSEAELQSIATLEAMASGLPVIAADRYALPELVHPNRNGYLFPSGDAHALAHMMHRCLTQRKRWPLMGDASRKIAQQHDITSSVLKYIDIYIQTIERSKQRIA